MAYITAKPQGAATRKPADVVREWLEQAASEGRPDHYSGKRKHPRIDWHAPAIVRVRAGQPDERAYYGQCTNLSTRGAAVRCSEGVPEGSVVVLHINDGEESVSAKVKHCSVGVGSYLLGLEFLLEAG